MRIVFIIPTLNQGGAEHQLHQFVRGLDRDRFDITVCCLRMGGPLERKIRELGVPVKHFNRTRKADMWAIAKLTLWLRKRRPDVVHTWLPTANLWGRIAAILAGCPTIVASERSVDAWKSPLRRLADRILAKRTSVITANAEAVRDFYTEKVGVPSQKIVTVHNGLDLIHIQRTRQRSSEWQGRVTSELRLSNDSLVVGTVARVSRAKCLEDFVRVAALVCRRVESARFLIVGGATYSYDHLYLRQIERQVVEEGLEEKLIITGYLDDPTPYLLTMAVFLQTSIKEGLPNAVMEAMGCGVPVVATDVGGTRELVENGTSGYLAPANDTQTLAKNVLELLESPDKRNSFGRSASARMREQFTQERMVDAMSEIYRRALQSRVGGEVSA